MFEIMPYKRWQEGLDRRWGFNLDRMFDHMFQEFDDKMLLNYPIKVDVKEKKKEYLLEAELPGVDKEDIHLEAKDDVLTISVERKEEINEEKENYIRRERRYGSFRRSFYVNDVEQREIKAKFKNGLLRVVLPKKKSISSDDNTIPIE